MSIDTYNPHQLVTLRVIRDGVESFEVHKATDLEYKLEAAKLNTQELDAADSKLNYIKAEMTTDSWYSDSTDKNEVLEKLEEILGHSPTATISITASIEVYMTLDVPLRELDDFDADAIVSDQLSIDTGWGEATVDSWELQSADWEQQ
jgi:hypothetical protein